MREFVICFRMGSDVMSRDLPAIPVRISSLFVDMSTRTPFTSLFSLTLLNTHLSPGTRVAASPCQMSNQQKDDGEQLVTSFFSTGHLVAKF